MAYHYEMDSLSGEESVRFDKPPRISTTRVIIGDEAFQQARIKDPPKVFSSPVLLFSSLVAFCCSTCNGYDGSLLNPLLANKNFRDFFSVANVGIEAGIVNSMYQIGSVVALPIVGPAIDTWGRRPGMFIGGFIIVIGVIIQITCLNTQSVNQFMAGRFFLGYGVSIMSAAGPTYVVEMAHPAFRGIMTGLYNVMWPVGALAASGAARGGLNYEGNTTWMIPLTVQLMFPGIVVLCAFVIPESPRWYYTRGFREEATALLIRHHGNGDPDSEWVKLELMEYEHCLELDGSDKRWWDYRALFRDRASVYRLACNCIVSLFGQWAGNSIVSYYLSAFLDTAGIHGSVKQTDVQLGMNAIQIAFAGTGATFVDRIGRRPMLFWVNIACCLCWIGVIVPASIADVSSKSADPSVDPSVSRAILAWVYIFQICYSFGWTPMQALYPVEVISFEMRAKGMAFSSLFVNTALLATQFGVPVALQRISWRLYIVFCAWCMIQAAVFYFFIPETKNRTLEELDEIFQDSSPVKKSLERKKLDVDIDHNVVHVDIMENLHHRHHGPF